MPAADHRDDLRQRVRSARRTRLFTPEDLPPSDMGASQIEAILPHRDPMRLVDRVRGLDTAAGRAWGERDVTAADRGFDGHFVDHPVYPGVFQLEGAGQLALLTAALGRGLSEPVAVRLTRVIEAAFLREVQPDSVLTMLSEAVEDDGYVLTSVGQVLVGETIVCACAFEAMWTQ